MDTWATSSLTPQIAGRWIDDPDLFARVFPMDLRPQAHDIIRTWLFATVVRSHLEFDSAPWSDVAISGWILDPDRKKMSKSKGNVVTPMDLLERHGSDAVRYWAASGRPGTDTAFDDGQMKVGRRLAIKILNVSRFVLELAARDDPEAAAAPPAVGRALEPIDAALLRAVADLVDEATTAFEGYDYARALERTEALFWTFCDDYVELVKSRAYGDPADDRVRSARATLRQALSVFLRLFAPVLPFVTEEVWSWWHEDGSIHRAPWPVASEVGGAAGDPALLGAVGAVLSEVRRHKSNAGVTLRAPVERVTVTAAPDLVDRVQLVAGDLRQAGVIDDLRWNPSDTATVPEVVVELA
jgi:valyl-tRNA synthetase